MPRIDPLQLLRCLSVLLSPEGGILSADEVSRLVNLMTKFSKKLVSKCVYILILRNTETELVDMFMAEGGWTLIQTWLLDALGIFNWDLIIEILNLLLVTPVDVERLKLNNIPKLVKSLSRQDEHKGVQQLSQQLVNSWLVIVRNSTRIEEAEHAATENETYQSVKQEPTEEDTKISVSQQIQVVEISNEQVEEFTKDTLCDVSEPDRQSSPMCCNENDQQEPTKNEVSFSEELVVSTESTNCEIAAVAEKTTDNHHTHKRKDKSRDKHKEKSHSSSRHHSSSKHKSSSKDKHEKRDKDKHKKHSENSSSKKSSTTSSRDPSKQAEKDQDTLAKLKPQSLDKLGRIPKKSTVSNSISSPKNDPPVVEKGKDKKEAARSTMSVEVRKPSEERPKTVKVYNSKRRVTGLEEEVKPPPPPSRSSNKKAIPTPVTNVTVVNTLKRSSPTKEISANTYASPIPEKKLKVDLNSVLNDVSRTERPGAIKLIPPKPKPILQESDIFMDALTASATKKDIKKRKRRPSTSKDSPETATPTPTTVTTPELPSVAVKALNFYQETMNSSADNEVNEKAAETCTQPEGDAEQSFNEVSDKPPPHNNTNPDGSLRSVLVAPGATRRSKRSVRFNDSQLTHIRHFDLDETERVNVTRTFVDMAKMELTSEREAVKLSRKLVSEDTMEAQTIWRQPLWIVEIAEGQQLPVVPGSKSLEKDVQFAREKSVLQALYFDKRKIPDSPEEPVPDNYQVVDPVIIPLDDAEGQEMDLRNTPWPEAKGSPPHPTQPVPVFSDPLQMHPHIQPQIPMHPQIFAPPPNTNPMLPISPHPQQQFHPQHFVPPPPHWAPNMAPRFAPPFAMQNGPSGPTGPPGPPMQQSGVAFGNNMMNNVPTDMNFHNGPPPNMFPPPNFTNRGRGNNVAGGFRRGGSNGSWAPMGRGAGNNWNRGGGGNRGGRLCKHVKIHGYCRNMDKCPFIHPNN